MNIYWFEQRLEDVPSDQGWLSASEVERLRTMRFPKRRMDWLLGRWTAKNAVTMFLELPESFSGLREIEIHAAVSGAPDVYIRSESVDIEISLSHRACVGACVIAPCGALLGCDLELVEAHNDAFTTDYFDAEEQMLISSSRPTDRSLVVALLWSAKESALKALKQGLRLDTRLINVACSIDEAGEWKPLQVRCRHGQTLSGWWTERGGVIRTALAAPPPDTPIVLSKNETTKATHPI